MALTVKDPPSPGMTAADAQSPAVQPPRANPVCLEAPVTIRTLPAEGNGATAPVREEGKTVIIFDNGAVLRISSKLPPGQTVVLSNQNKREIACRVVSGRSLPNVKGYVEVEFIEPALDFWRSQEQPVSTLSAVGAAPSPARLAPAASASSELMPEPRVSRAPAPVTVPSPVPDRIAPAALRAAPPQPAPQLAASPAPSAAPVYSGSGSSFEDAGELLSIDAPVTQQATRPGMDPSSEADAGSVKVDRGPHQADSLVGSPVQEAQRGFMSGGFIASSVPSLGVTPPAAGRFPLILGGALAVLLLAGGGIYFVQHRNVAPPSPSVASESPAVHSAAATNSSDISSQGPAPAGSAEPSKVEAESANAAAADSSRQNAALSNELPTARGDKESSVSNDQPVAASPRKPAITSLKIGAPIVPKVKTASADQPELTGALVMTDSLPAGTPAGLLSASPRAPKQPAAPSTPAPVVSAIRAAQLISSVRPVYPMAAKQSNVQGKVLVLASVDATGKVTSATAQSGPMLLRQAAVDSVKQWKYSPAIVDGKPSVSQVSVAVDFHLQ